MERVVELHIKVVEWDNLQNVASALLGHGEVTKISGSREYRKIMSETSNWGKALTETTIAEAELRVQYESRKRWLAAERREKERIEAQIGLDESRREISLELTSAIGLTAFHVSNAAQDGLQNLASFNPPPQPFNNLNIRITDSPTACVNATECPVSLLKETRRLHVEIRHDHPNFLSWDRVRIEKIRVFLIGATLPSNRMRVSISTSGEFFDRYRSIEQDFVSVPLRRGFEYNPSSNGVIVDGNIHDDFHGYYSLTTPFTTWVIDVSTGLNTGLDLSRLSRVELHMWGSLVSGSRDAQVCLFVCLFAGLDLSRLSRVELHKWGSLVSGSRDGQVCLFVCLLAGLDLSKLSPVELHMWGSLVSGRMGGQVCLFVCLFFELDLSRLSRVERHKLVGLVSGSRDGQVLDNMVIDL
uniref:Uncharacterized protein n=1 Tax=Branchiostoma floridae TaxID=7739 RepID=C3ZK18_BRAFL|eukprot:XP_002591105.1 hypothetical protein BRAFLDRAFT_108715 [Branchiostoma floridae]